MASLLGLLLPPVAMAAGGYFLTSWLTGQSIPLAHKVGAIAHPNERSSHQEPTPRIGGIGLVGGLLALTIVNHFATIPFQKMDGYTDFAVVPLRETLILVGATLVAFGVGLWDDLKSMSAVAKLVLQGIIALIPAVGGLALRQIYIPFMEPLNLPFWAGGTITWLWLMLMMNAVNFMDGINGLAGRFGEMFACFLFFCVFNSAWTQPYQTLAGALAGCCWGFLKWNSPTARTFMGDCGSQALGAYTAIASLLLCNADIKLPYTTASGITFPLYMPFLACVLAASPFLFDVLFTMARRALRGENLFKAHRGHLYQRYVASSGESHGAGLELLSWVLGIAAALGVVFVRFSTATDHGFRALLVAGTCGLLFWYWTTVVRAEKRAGVSA